MIEGEEVDVTNVLPSLTAIFDAESIRELAEGETPQLLLVPNDGEPEAQVSTVQYIEACLLYTSVRGAQSIRCGSLPR